MARKKTKKMFKKQNKKGGTPQDKTKTEQIDKETRKKVLQVLEQEHGIKSKTKSPEKIEDAFIFVKDQITELFADQENISYAQYSDRDKKILSAIESQEFSDWLRITLFEKGNFKENWVEGVQKLLDSTARRTTQKKLYLRCASVNDDWYYQISKTECVKLTNKTVKLIESPTIFRVNKLQAAAAVDLKAEPKDILLIRPFLKFKNLNDEILFICSLPCYFAPHEQVSKAITFATGVEGSAKSTICKLLKKIVDPTNCNDDGISLPKDERDWVVQARTQFFLLIDNVSYLKEQEQDIICRYITGSSAQQRRLYTNLESVETYLKGALAFTGITITGLRGDFSDRSLIWLMDRIPDEERVNESIFWPLFEHYLPKIRGACLKILAIAKENMHAQDIKTFRLADFANLASACAEALGVKKEEFVKLIETKAVLQREETAQNNLITEPLLNFMKNHNKWTGTASALLKELTKQEYGEIIGIGENERTTIRNTPKNWPKNANTFGNLLTRLEVTLKYFGFMILRDRTNRQRTLTINKTEQNLVTDVTQTFLLTEKKSVKQLFEEISSCHPELFSVGKKGDKPSLQTEKILGTEQGTPPLSPLIIDNNKPTGDKGDEQSTEPLSPISIDDNNHTGDKSDNDSSKSFEPEDILTKVEEIIIGGNT